MNQKQKLLELIDQYAEAAPKAAPGEQPNYVVSLVVIKEIPTGFNTQNKLYAVHAGSAEEAIGKAVAQLPTDFPEHRLHTSCLVQVSNKAPQQEAQKPIALLVRKNSWRAGQWEAAPPDSPSYGLAWANQRQYVYAAPQPEPAPLTRDQIREVFMAHGFTIKEGQTDLKQYVYDAAHALLELVAAPQPASVSDDTLYLLRRLLSNQHTLTGSEFRAELEKIVGEAYQQKAPDGGSCTDGNTPGLMPADAELLAHIKKAVPGLTRVNTALMVAKAVLEKFGSRRVASEVK